MDEDQYFCARCTAELPMGNCEEAWCDKCHARILSPADYLTPAQLRERQARDHEAWNAAIAVGLIVPPKAGG